MLHHKNWTSWGVIVFQGKTFHTFGQIIATSHDLGPQNVADFPCQGSPGWWNIIPFCPDTCNIWALLAYIEDRTLYSSDLCNHSKRTFPIRFHANMADSIFQETSHWKDPSTWVIAWLQLKGSVGKVPFNFWWIQSTSTRTNKYEGTPLRKTTNDDRSFCFPTTLVWIYGLPVPDSHHQEYTLSLFV